MRPAVVVPPPPILDLATVKAHLRLDGPDDDAYLAGLMAVAQGAIDGPAGWLGTSIGPQTLEWRAAGFDAVGGEGVPLPYGPVTGLVSVQFATPDGAIGTVDPAACSLAGDTLALAPTWRWPVTAHRPDAVRIRYTAGGATGDQYTFAGDHISISTAQGVTLQQMVAALAQRDAQFQRTINGVVANGRRRYRAA